MSDVATWVGSGAGVLALVGAVIAIRVQKRAFDLQGIQARAEAKARQLEQADREREQADREREQADREREQADKERQQADLIDVTHSATTRDQTGVLKSTANPSESLHMVAVVNASNRPIFDVSARLDVVDKQGLKGYLFNQFTRTGKTPPAEYGNPGQGTYIRKYEFENLFDIPQLLAGQEAAFVWDIPSYKSIDLQYWIRFTDDKGLHWQIDSKLHLQKLDTLAW